jgi:DNA modification methylase
MTVDIICADACDALGAMPVGSVHACITSPPYWGLRDYGLEPGVWGSECEHEWGESIVSKANDSNRGDMEWTTGGPPGAKVKGERVSQGAFCRRCNAWRGSLGLEPTPELYVEHIVQVMREIRRVLRDDGTLWLNLGDSYSSGGRDYRDPGKRLNSDGRLAGLEKKGTRPPTPDGLKPKDLVGVPWRVAFALQADGWWLRSDIIWSKPNPMPESVTDRPTRSHEYLFLLSKSARYYYDADAIREPKAEATVGDPRTNENGHRRKRGYPGEPSKGGTNLGGPQGGRNRRSVWEIATQPYAKAHFATFPEKLVEPCILAGCPEGGKVLDPFAGSGTVGLVAERLGRHSVLIDASEDYCRMARERTAQMGLMEQSAPH